MRGKILNLITLIVLVILYSGCKPNLEVENPNEITDEDLNLPYAIPAIVTGAAADFAVAYQYTVLYSGLLSNELIHIGSFPTYREMHDGQVQDNNISMEDWYGALQRARWVAEKGAERVVEIVGADSAKKMIEYAMLHIYAGYSLIQIADMWDGSPIDGSPIIPRSEIYDRAIAHFTEVINIADGLPATRTYRNGTTQTLNKSQVKAIAYLGRARAKFQKGDLSGAYQDVADPSLFTGLTFYAIYSENSDRENNAVYIFAYDRPEVAVGPRHQITGDPRVPVQPPSGARTYWRQAKYPTRADDIPIAKWQEAALIRVEYFLNQGNTTAALAEINSYRSAYNLPPLTTIDIETLREERKREFFLEGMYLQDLRRFDDPFLQGRMAFFPLGRREKDSNPNV